METVIIQSKMNRPDFDDRNKYNYKKARYFLNLMPLDKWIRIEQIPDKIRFPVIDLIDGGFDSEIFSVIDETSQYILMTKKNIYNSIYEAKKINLNKINGIKYCVGCGEYKRVQLFGKDLTEEDDYKKRCKICSTQLNIKY